MIAPFRKNGAVFCVSKQNSRKNKGKKADRFQLSACSR